MALTRKFRETVADRAKHDSEFRAALLEEAIQALLDGDAAEAQVLLRTCINATIGFDGLSSASGMAAKSLMRMVSSAGNPTLKNFACIVRVIQEQTEVKACVEVRDASLLEDCVIMAEGSCAAG